MLPLAIALTLAASPAAKPAAKTKPAAVKPAEPAPAAAPAPVAAPAPQPGPAAPATPEVPAAPAAPAVVESAPPATPGTARVGVVDFTSTPDLQPLAAALGGYVANELQRLGAFQVTTTDQIRQMLSLERQAQLLGCPDDSCRGQTVVSLGFDWVVTGKLSKLSAGKGATYTLELVLIDQKKGERAASDVATGSSESELMGQVSRSVVKLVAVPLKARSGQLVLASSEAGATVKVDDVIIGTTPVGQSTVAGGPHFVSVEKTGFVSWQKEVRVKPDELVEENVRLVPSPDFIDAYRSKQVALRAGTYLAAALSVASVITGVVMGFRAQALYGNEQTPGTFLGERAFINNGIEVGDDGVNHRDNVNSLKAQISTAQVVSYVGICAGAAFGLTAVVLRLLSDDPNKYDLYRSADVKVKVGAALSPGGGGAVLSGAF